LIAQRGWSVTGFFSTLADPALLFVQLDSRLKLLGPRREFCTIPTQFLALCSSLKAVQEPVMPRIFPRAANTIARASFIGAFLTAALVLWACLVYTRSPYGTGERIMQLQPVPFS
jgi:hypothetical protein